MSGNFSIGLCEIGDCNACMYSCFCPCCALAESRTALDGSGWCFNFWCLPVVPYRWMVRSMYGIGDKSDCCEDFYISCCCLCCTANQLYQTTKTLGNPTSNGGAGFNTGEMAPLSKVDYSCAGAGTCLYTCLCFPCFLGDLLKQAYGMPWWMGCCCTNLCFARNSIRYHYRLRSTSGTSDCMEECMYPSLFHILLNILGNVFPPIVWCEWVVHVFFALNLKETVKMKDPGDGKTGYIVGYTPGGAESNVVNVQPSGVVYPTAEKV